jgi:hypothetical protein
MNEPITDYFGLEPEKSEADRPIGLVTGAKLRPNELLAADQEHINSGSFPGSRDVLFTEEDDELTLEHATYWQGLMNWPRLPNAEEVMAFKLYQEAKLVRFYWGEKRAAQALDDADEAAAVKGRIDEVGRKRAALDEKAREANRR